ncbi:initiation factor 2B [Halobacteriales archaeon QH_10_67_22]|nr:MAG: initiation factor 2B [Halobacteriales archaeon QH_10_67_22]
MIDETVAEIADMQTHSSSVVAVKAARALLALSDREYPTVAEYLRALEQNSDALRRANISHASLQTTQREVVERVTDGDPESVAAAKLLTEDVVTEIVERVEQAKRRAAERAAGRLGDGETVFTHDYSSTVLAALRTAVAGGTDLTVYCSEARPRFLGRKMTRALAAIDGIEPHLTVDGACGTFLSECDRVLVGMDCIVDGTLYNRVGTYPLAATAADVGVPVHVVGAASKVVESGFVFENEHRSISEVIREPSDDFVVENPAYDATPVRLVEDVTTDDGIREF